MAETGNVSAVSYLSSTQIDHIIILLSAADFENVPLWLSDNFTIIEGGTHSKGTSKNKLIIFKDGTYLELFCWVDPQPAGIDPHADFPSWAEKPEGCIIDWALTGADAHSKYDEITSRLKDLLSQGHKLNVTYDEPLAGGRRRKDGQELRWVTTRPRRLNTREGTSPPDVPFFCHDISPRILRVPYAEGSIENWPEVVTHPCGAVGVSNITVEVPGTELESFATLYEVMLGASSEENQEEGQSAFDYRVPSPEQVVQLTSDLLSPGNEGQNPDTSQTDVKALVPTCLVRLVGSSNASEQSQRKSATGLQRLVLLTENPDRKGQRLDTNGFGTPILLS